MSRTLSQFFREEYTEFRKYLVANWVVDRQHFNKFDTQIKKIHKRYLSLACTATVIGCRAKRNEYIEGVVEVSHLCLVLTLKGLENPVCVLLRQSIELVLKHIYFSNHSVEYEWARSREDYRDLTFQTLLEYLRRTDECKKLDSCDDICTRLNYWFGVLSRHVHVHSRGFMGYCEIGSAYKPKNDIIKKLNERTKEIWPVLTALLIVYFPKRYFKASPIEQSLIKSILPNNLQQQVDQYLLDHA